MHHPAYTPSPQSIAKTERVVSQMSDENLAYAYRSLSDCQAKQYCAVVSHFLSIMAAEIESRENQAA